MGIRTITITAGLSLALFTSACAMPAQLRVPAVSAPAAAAPVAAPAASSSAALPTPLANESCAAGLAKISTRQTAVPAPKTTATALPPNYTPVPKPATATPGPAPEIDRVGFPKDYLNTFKLMYVYDRPDTKQVRVVCGNDIAMSRSANQPFAYGSMLVMTIYRAREENGQLMKDPNGHFILDVPTNVFVMRKETGYGEAYAHLRNGEWEYAAYRPNGTPQMPPQGTYACAACHLALAPVASTQDWTFRTGSMFEKGSYLAPSVPISNEVLISSMALFPRSFKVQAGNTITWTNGDTIAQVLTAKDGSFPATTIKPGEQFSFAMPITKTGRFEFSVSESPHQLIGAIQVTK